MNEPQQPEVPRGLKVDSGGSIFEAREEGACGEGNSLEMWRDWLIHTKNSQRKRAAMGIGGRVFLGKEHFLFQMWDERKSA